MTYIESVDQSNKEIELCFSNACSICSNYKYENYDHMRRAIHELTIGLYVDIKDLKTSLIGHKGKIKVPQVRQSVLNEIKEFNREKEYANELRI